MFNNIKPPNTKTKKEKKKEEKEVEKKEKAEKPIKEKSTCQLGINHQENGSLVLDIKLKSLIDKNNANFNLFKNIKVDLDNLKDIVGKLPPL